MDSELTGLARGTGNPDNPDDPHREDEERTIIPPVPLAGAMAPAAGAAMAIGLGADPGGAESEEERGARLEDDDASRHSDASTGRG